jgi:hypothetical protein
MATKFINNFLITHPNLLGANLKINKNLELLHSASALGRGTVLEPLRGHNSTSIKNTNHHEMFGYEIADWTSDFPMTWAEITDLKAQELWAQSRSLNRPVLLRWSGGIDSTLVLIALLKHARADDLDRLVVATTKAGVWESSHIYFTCLANKVKTVDFDYCVPSLTTDTFANFIHVSGSPCDQLMIGMVAMSEPAQKDPSWFDVPWKNTAKLREYLSLTRLYNGKNTEGILRDYIIKILCDNIESLDTDIHSIHQFIWWFNFNFFSIAQGAHEYTHWHANNGIPVGVWKNHVFPWFYDPRYQKWAMTNSSRPDIIFGKNDWKVPLKQYIYDYVQDPYYLEYKPKIGSHGRTTWQVPNKGWFAITDDEIIDISDQRCSQILIDAIA